MPVEYLKIILFLISVNLLVSGRIYSFPVFRLKFDNTVTEWIPRNSIYLREYINFTHKFPSYGILIIAFEDKNGFTSEGKIKEVKKTIKTIEKINGVKQISEWPLPYMHNKKKIPEWIKCFVLFFKTPSALNPNNTELLKRITDVLKKHRISYHLAGTGVIYNVLNSETQKETIIFFLIGLIIIFTVLFLILKDIKSIFIVISISIGGILSILIFNFLTGIPFTILSMVLPTFIFFYGTSNSLHTLYHNGNFSEVFIPCVLTSITTMAGFLVFTITDIPLLRNFGIMSAIGIAGTFLTTFFIFKKFHLIKNTKLWGISPLTLEKLQSKKVIYIILLMSILIVPGLFKIKAETYSLSFIPSKNKARLDHNFIEKYIGFYIPLEYVINTKTFFS